MILWFWLAWAGITIDPSPVLGQESTIVVVSNDGAPAPGRTVQVSHRPGLAGEAEEAIGITDGLGRVRWTPSTAGVSILRAGEETRAIQVAWNAPPWDTLAWLILLILASGAGLFYDRMTRRA